MDSDTASAVRSGNGDPISRACLDPCFLEHVFGTGRTYRTVPFERAITPRRLKGDISNRFTMWTFSLMEVPTSVFGSSWT